MFKCLYLLGITNYKGNFVFDFRSIYSDCRIRVKEKKKDFKIRQGQVTQL